MKKIDAIIRAERLSIVKEQLKSLDISGMTVYSVYPVGVREKMNFFNGRGSLLFTTS